MPLSPKNPDFYLTILSLAPFIFVDTLKLFITVFRYQLSTFVLKKKLLWRFFKTQLFSGAVSAACPLKYLSTM